MARPPRPDILLLAVGVGLAASAIFSPPWFRCANPTRAKEAALRETLFTLRTCIDQYRADHGSYPTSLSQLVAERYMRKVPMHPFTRIRSWRLIREADRTGIEDVRSAYSGTASDGSRYEKW